MIPIRNATLVDRMEGRLLTLAAFFLGVFCAALSLAPLVRAHSTAVSAAWSHWLAFAVWLVVFNLTHFFLARRLPNRDPFLVPVAGLLAGWGLLTIYRLYPAFGLRQTGWLALASIVFILGLNLSPDFRFLRRYKYLWLSGGLLLTGLTLFMGVNPLGYGPKMWLGCCGVYLQPSEPLKLLLIVYLAAYLADRLFPPADGTAGYKAKTLLPILAPSLVMTGLALALLVIQRDLGTASIFLFLYAVMVYIASGRRRIALIALAGLLAASVAGYRLFDVVRVRFDAWLNPWLDPSGRSYQIVQSLLAVANGGLIGRGPGLGNPGLVPVAHSDFIFSALFEETGLVGAVGFIVLIALLVYAGLRSALRARDAFQRYLAAGLTAYVAGQSILIIAGNLRLLPLTGVTLPFVSYGGSSLLVSMISLLFLVLISDAGGASQTRLADPKPLLELAAILLVGLAATIVVASWWSVARSADLLARTDNPRRSINDRYVRRGALLDRENRPINQTEGEPGQMARQITYPDLSAIAGYTDPVYGQAGLEASLDPYLRGLQGNPLGMVWLNHLLYGQPPPGLDMRTSLDLDLQASADRLLSGHTGALVLLNAETGEILAMASHPTFNANRLSELGESLIKNPEAPLLNRAAQGLYPVGSALQDFRLPDTEETDLFQKLGLFTPPLAYLEASSSTSAVETENPTVQGAGVDVSASPLQMGLAAAVLSAAGVRPAPYLVTAVIEPELGWVVFPPQGAAYTAMAQAAADQIAGNLAIAGQPFWQSVAVAAEGKKNVSWFLGGTLPEWNGTRLALAVLLEEDNPDLVEQIGQKMLLEAI